MLQKINGMLRSISDLRDEIEQIKGLPGKITDQVNSEIEDSVPDFSSVLSQKKAARDGSIDSVIKSAGGREGVGEDLLRSVIDVESNFNPDAVSEDGARGLMQLMPSTAEQLGVNPDNPQENIEGGAKYLGQMLDRFGNLKEALAAYNAGPQAVEDYGGVPPFQETQNYVKNVLDKYRQLKQER